MKRLFQAIAVATAVAFFQGTAQAVPLPPGGTVSLVPAVETGTLVAYMSIPFTFGSPSSASRIVGTLNEGVFREAGGTLDFAYQVSVTSAGSKGNVANITTADFSNVLTDVAYTNGVASASPMMSFAVGNTTFSTASRSVDGSTLSFVPTVPLTAGLTSFVALVATNATSFDQFGSVTVINSSGSAGGTFGIAGTFEPIAPPVPEPVTLVLWGGSFAGLACIGALRRRKAPVSQV
jgi:hypothetical protein